MPKNRAVKDPFLGLRTLTRKEAKELVKRVGKEIFEADMKRRGGVRGREEPGWRNLDVSDSLYRTVNRPRSISTREREI